MDFTGSGQRLSGEDFERAAERIGCDIAAVRAVAHVEARGQGFDARLRPIVLFEPHVFYRNLAGIERQRAVNAGLAWSTWQPGRYPKTQDDRYRQIAHAATINEAAALMAASWGIGQVLGESWKLCGFESPAALVSRCLAGEGGQLDVMVAFILGRGLGDELRRRDWAGFAYGYNGKAYARNHYDLKLDRAWRRFSALASVAYDPLSDGLLSLGDKGEVVKALQRALGTHADGDFGPMTVQAVRDFQREHGLTVDGKVGRQSGNLLGLTFWG